MSPTLSSIENAYGHHAAPTTLCKCPWFMFMGTRMHAVPVFQLACPLWLSGVMCNISAVFTQIEQTRHRLASQIVTKVGLEALWLQHADEKKKKKQRPLCNTAFLRIWGRKITRSPSRCPYSPNGTDFESVAWQFSAFDGTVGPGPWGRLPPCSSKIGFEAWFRISNMGECLKYVFKTGIRS